MFTLHPTTSEHQTTKHRSMEKTTQKIRGLFRRTTNEECGAGVRGAAHKRESHTSPSHTAQDKASSLGKGARKGKDRRNEKGMWRPKKRKGDWESYSGRQLTLQEVSIRDLSPMEVEFLQREAVTRLQKMDVAVSHGILKALSSRGAFQRSSSNSQARRKITDKAEQHAVFGQPLEAIVGSTPPTPQSHASSPSSPTRTSEGPLEEFNMTPNVSNSSLLDPYAVTSPPSPRTLRRQALTPSEQQVPTLVKKTIEHLDTKGVKLEGLFRIPGSKARIAELREKIDAGLDVELNEDTNPHDVACLLKEFFRSLPEPLLTRDLYYPFLSTTKFDNPGRRRDALRLLCVLLPQPNRDTLQELLQFLSRVALHSYGMILIDGTEESGNRMTEQNLGTVLGPNILHKESKRKPAPKSGPEQYQVVKQDPEELSNVAKVIEDLIRMHKNVFTIPPELQDPVLRQILLVDPDAVDHLLKKRCIDLGLVLPPREDADIEPLKVAPTPSAPGSSTTAAHSSTDMHVRSQSFSTSQKTLEEALENLTQYINEGLSPVKTAANQMAMESPTTELDGPPSITTANVSATETDSPSSTATKDTRKCRSPLALSRELYASADSAFSNNSSSHSSTELVSDTVSDAVSCSEMNTFSCNSTLGDKGFMDNSATPPNGTGGLVSTHSMPTLMLDSLSGNKSYAFEGGSSDRGKLKKLSVPNNKWRHRNIDEHYEIQRSPILSSKESRQFYDVLAGIPSDRTPTHSTFSVPTSAPISEDGTMI
ncbi:hypothetical protein EMCRGX_G033893 [Ephydatia muelleri]